jgi:hypothetical protein
MSNCGLMRTIGHTGTGLMGANWAVRPSSLAIGGTSKTDWCLLLADIVAKVESCRATNFSRK